MRFVRIGCLAVALTAAGCSTFSDLKVGLQGMMGRPVGDLTAQFGTPLAVARKDGGKVYTWRYQHAYDHLIPEPTFVHSTLAGITGFFPIPTYSTETKIHRCTVTAAVDAKGIIQSGHFDGNRSACAWFTERIGRK